MSTYRYPVPASFFGMVLGVAGLGNAWRIAARIWLMPTLVGEIILALAALLWITLVAMYFGKWIFARETAQAEMEHEVQSGFIALVPLTTMLMALAVAPYSSHFAVILWVIGVVGQLGYGVFSSGRLWKGGRDSLASTTVLYLPTVGVNFVAAMVAGSLNYPEWGALFFGAGAFAWIALESIILQRHMTGPATPVEARSTLGIQLAPPVVGAMAYLAITTGKPDVFVQALLGYGLFHALLLVRLIPWLRQQPFGPGVWAFTFGITALAAAPMRLIERGGTGPLVLIAWPLFVFANGFLIVITVRTVRLATRGRLLARKAATSNILVDPVKAAC
jgi:tellurite resistance protein